MDPPWLRALVSALDAPPPSSPPVAIRPSLCNSLLPYQQAAVEFALRRGGRVLLGHEMGLGKTVETLGLIVSNPATQDKCCDAGAGGMTHPLKSGKLVRSAATPFSPTFTISSLLPQNLSPPFSMLASAYFL